MNEIMNNGISSTTSTTSCTTNISSSNIYSFNKYDEKYCASRQKFLRSYKFTEKKESIGTRTKNWLKKKPKAVINCSLFSGNGRKFWFISCMVKLDVHE